MNKLTDAEKLLIKKLEKQDKQIEDLKGALRNLLTWTDGQEHLHGLTDSGKQKYRTDIANAKKVLK